MEKPATIEEARAMLIAQGRARIAQASLERMTEMNATRYDLEFRAEQRQRAEEAAAEAADRAERIAAKKAQRKAHEKALAERDRAERFARAQVAAAERERIAAERAAMSEAQKRDARERRIAKAERLARYRAALALKRLSDEERAATEAAERERDRVIRFEKIEARRTARDLELEAAREARRAEEDRILIEALYDHPGTLALLQLYNATRWNPEAHVADWFDVLDSIPVDLRQYAFAIQTDYDPLYPVARAIATMGGETLEQLGRVYGVSKERVRQLEAGAIRSLEKLAEVRAMRECMEEDIGWIRGVAGRPDNA
jgi:hypothetical protein